MFSQSKTIFSSMSKYNCRTLISLLKLYIQEFVMIIKRRFYHLIVTKSTTPLTYKNIEYFLHST